MKNLERRSREDTVSKPEQSSFLFSLQSTKYMKHMLTSVAGSTPWKSQALERRLKSGLKSSVHTTFVNGKS